MDMAQHGCRVGVLMCMPRCRVLRSRRAEARKAGLSRGMDSSIQQQAVDSAVGAADDKLTRLPAALHLSIVSSVNIT
jgi:hypothetical protein